MVMPVGAVVKEHPLRLEQRSPTYRSGWLSLVRSLSPGTKSTSAHCRNVPSALGAEGFPLLLRDLL